MNGKNLITTLGSSFLGGVASFAATHMASGPPTTVAQGEAFAIGAALTGLVAAIHLYETSPTDKPALAALKDAQAVVSANRGEPVVPA